jgi:hypothetical protein
MKANGCKQIPPARDSEPPRANGRRRWVGTAGLISLIQLVVGALIPGQAVADPVANALFPLSIGDTWNYETASRRLAQVRITDRFQYRDHEVYRVQGYLFGFSDADVLFFSDRNGMIAELNPGLASVGDAPGRPHTVLPLISGIWYPWSDLGRRVQIPQFAPDCIHGTSGEMKNGDLVEVPAGEFTDALTIRYDTHPCADQDLISESFAPGIGLVARTVSTFVGEERWALTSAMVSGLAIGLPGDPSGGRGSAAAPVRGTQTWGAIKAAFAR